MKTLNLIFAIFLFSSISLYAQNETETLFGRSTRISGFGAPIVEFSNIKGQFAVSNGGGGAVLFNQTFFLGGYGISMSNSIAVNASGTSQRLDFGHGGFWLGYVNSHKKLVHFTSGLRLGWGGLNLKNNNSFGNNFNTRLSNCFVATPEVGFEVNITSFFKISATAGYRFVSGVGNVQFTDTQGAITESISNSDFNSPMGSLTFKFGWFGR